MGRTEADATRVRGDATHFRSDATLVRGDANLVRVSKFTNFPDFARFLQNKNESAAVPHSMDIQCNRHYLMV